MISTNISTLSLQLALGFIGALIIIIGYIFNQLKIWQANDFEYDFINLLGSSILLYYSYQIQAWPFIALFSIWALFSLKDCIFDYLHRFDWKKEKKKRSKK